MKKAKAGAAHWYHQRAWAAVIVLVSLLLAYGMVSLAIDSGSLLQYFAAITLVLLAVNRAGHLVLITVGYKEDGRQ